jgi:hypothetical protein
MLGCHDFCGYYDWTFHYVQRRWGRTALELLWSEAIGGDSQRHYAEPAMQHGLRALYSVWVGTGEDEHCDWTFTLDEDKNVLRWDMRKCPSKGFLLERDLNADEDYCNHCMGWIIPMLSSIGAEVAEHEHNHCGQCWATMRMKDRSSRPLLVDADIRSDPRWNCGYLDRWADNRPLTFQPPVGPGGDPCEVLESWFRETDVLTLLDNALDVCWSTAPPARAVLASDAAYNDRRQCPVEPRGVLIACPPIDLAATAARYCAAKREERPLLMHPFLPAVPWADFVSTGLPRPVPILPLLIRKGKYAHQPGGPHPTTAEFLALLAAALDKKIVAT